MSAAPIVLASSSPRRRELLEKAGVQFEIVVSAAEEIHDASLSPAVLCEHNAQLKAAEVAARRPEARVIGSDTLVFLDGVPLGKPKDMDEARSMLRSLSGRTHQVCTGVCLISPGGVIRRFHDTADVTFLPLDDALIDLYFSQMNPLDKAGSYGIQETGVQIIAGIEGHFETVMGLPAHLVLEALGGEEEK
jgi:septum formation protein